MGYCVSGCLDIGKLNELSSAYGLAGAAGSGGSAATDSGGHSPLTGDGGVFANVGGRFAEAGASGSRDVEPVAGAGTTAAGGATEPGGGAGGDTTQGGASAGNTSPAGGVVSGGVSTGGAANTGGATQGPPEEEAGAGGYFDGPCPTATSTGWASVAGLDFDPAANQIGGTEVVVSTAQDLLRYSAATEPYVIRVVGTIAVPALDVSSNKTIVGDDAAATIEGGIRILGTSTEPAAMVSNVVIRNLHIDALTSDTSTLPDEDDGITVAYAHHVWIDHVEIWDAPGDGLDITNGASFVTVSWSKFRFDLGARRTASRVGNSDANAAEDTDRLKVTFHHNWWMDSVDQRMPRVRFGDVHVFNNYLSHVHQTTLTQTYCIAAAFESRLLVQNNYFDNVRNPHVFFSFVDGQSMFAEPTAQMVADGNTYIGDAQDEAGRQSGQGDAFVPPYPVELAPADANLKTVIRHCSGPQ